MSEMEHLLGDPDLSDDARCWLHFALGKAYDDCREYDQAFQHYHTGNELKRAKLGYTPERHARLNERIIEVFSKELIRELRGIGNASDIAIFVLGMPRSGTTLTEQIISAHPDVHGAGELSYFTSIAAGMGRLLNIPAEFPETCRSLDRASAALISEPYLKLLRWHSPTSRHVIDKLPGNYKYIGLIAVLFPNAKIIHCQRDPLDTCLSIYFQHFARGHEYAYDLHSIGETYRLYRQLMAHWQEVLPGRIYTSRYEDLVAHPEAQSRELIAACRLEWDDACLAFHHSRREVRTASVAQVRHGIYTHSTQRWKRYEHHLEPLKSALGIE